MTGANGTIGTNGAAGATGPTGIAGTAGTTGPTGALGTSSTDADTFVYFFDSTITAENPGTGKFRLNNFAAQNSATAVYISNKDNTTANNNIYAYFSQLSLYGSSSIGYAYLKIQDVQDYSNYVIYKVTAVTLNDTSSTGWITLTIANVVPIITPLISAHTCYISFTLIGPIGATGSTGPTGSIGPTGPVPAASLASTMTIGNKASTTLDMSSNDITNVTTLTATTITPTNITGWGVKSIVAGTNITVSNASGAVTINSTTVSLQVYSGAPVSIGSIAGFSNNQYYFGTSVYDFDNYNYDIEFVINQGSGAGILLYFCWDNDVNFNNYQLTYFLQDGGSSYVGSDAHSALFYTQNTNGFQASYKGTLRALPAPGGASNFNRLMLEGTLSFNFQTTGVRTFAGPARCHRSVVTYAGATQNSIAQFNGARSLSLWTSGDNYASNNPLHMRITRIIKNLPGS